MEPTFKDYLVTCRTPGCGNGGITIPVTAPEENPNFLCGVCTQTITDITPVTE